MLGLWEFKVEEYLVLLSRSLKYSGRYMCMCVCVCVCVYVSIMQNKLWECSILIRTSRKKYGGDDT